MFPRYFAVLVVIFGFLAFVPQAFADDQPFVLHVPTFMVHNVQTDIPVGNKNGGLFYRTESFDKLLGIFKSRGWHTVTAAQLADAMVGHQCLPPKTFTITFDDGHLNQYTNAYPLLLKYGFTATFAMITDWAGNVPTDPSKVAYFTWDQAREMAANGMEITNHTVTHRPIGHLSEADLDYQVMGAQDKITQEIGVTPTTFIYPYGSVGLGTAPDYLVAHGYELAFTDPGADGAVNGASESTADPMRAPRIRVSRSSSAIGLFRSARRLSQPCEGA